MLTNSTTVRVALIYWLSQYKSTNTDAAEGAERRDAGASKTGDNLLHPQAPYRNLYFFFWLLGVTPEQVRQETISCIHKHLTEMAFPCCADAQDSQITIPFVFE
jgi:hypothetical protein